MENKRLKKAENNRKYYDKHREKIIEHQKEKRLCTFCNQSYPLYHMSKHNKTIKHIDNVKNDIRLKNSAVLIV